MVGLLVVLAAQTALAQDAPPVAVLAGSAAADEPAPQIPSIAPANVEPAPSRPAALIPLYGSFATLQVVDLRLTFNGLDRGTREGNPVVAGFGSNRPAMIALKAGATAATIVLAERLWKKNRAAAVGVMVGLNAALAAVVAHNAQVNGRR